MENAVGRKKRETVKFPQDYRCLDDPERLSYGIRNISYSFLIILYRTLRYLIKNKNGGSTLKPQ